MSITREELLERFRELSDDYLVERIRSGELTGVARSAAEQELRQRGVPPPDEPQTAAVCGGDASEDGEFVTIARLLVPTQAHILRSRLEAEGVPVLMADGNFVQTNDLLSIAVGGIRVQVPASFVPQALEIMTAIRTGQLALDEDADPA
jgi:hypothetical protein